METAKANFPTNLARLHSGEEFLRERSLEAIRANPNLAAHFAVIESALDMLDYFSRHFAGTDPDTVTLRLLGARMFNAQASSIRLLLSGYYQTAALQQRDVLETVFLVDHFLGKMSRVKEWREAKGRERISRFGPAAVRKALDDRDKPPARWREATYKLFCEMAGHASSEGFALLVPTGMDLAHVGPFFDAKKLDAFASEAAKLSAHMDCYPRLFDHRTRADFVARRNFLVATRKWTDHFFGKMFYADELEAIEDILRSFDQIEAERQAQALRDLSPDTSR